MNTQYYLAATKQAFIAAGLVMTLLAASFFLVEPRVGQAVDSGPFTIKQTITGEISFLVNAANVTATGSINGLTGGTSNGTTTAVVQSNSSTGYEMFISFFNNGTDNAMYGDAVGSDAIRDYPASTTEPSYGFYTASTSSVFGYTVGANTPSDLDASFLHNGSSACNTGSSNTPAFNCWMQPTTSNFKIINRTTAATSGATTTIAFRVHVPNNPSPALVAGVYTATATLTALNQ